jgi:hypothetical protein
MVRVAANGMSCLGFLPASFERILPNLVQLGGDQRLQLGCGRGPVLLEPITKPLIRHQLAQLPKLAIKWLAVHSNVVNHDICDRVIAVLSVHLETTI